MNVAMLCRRLLQDADVVIENYRKGTMEKLGLGYDTLRALNPGLIYCEVSGFGRTGPYADRGGFDLIAQGMSGLMSITGEGPGRPPVKVGAPMTDITAGILAAMGVSAAWAHKLQTGVGQKVDTSLFEAGIIHTYWQSAIALATGESPGPMGTAHPLNAPYQAFETADGWINIGAPNDANWTRLADLIGAPELARDDRFASNDKRMENLDALTAELTTMFKTRTSADWLRILEQGGVPAGPILSVGEMHGDDQAQARDMIVEKVHPTAGPVKTLGLPVKFSVTPGGVRSPAPMLGQHTEAVLSESRLHGGREPGNHRRRIDFDASAAGLLRHAVSAERCRAMSASMSSRDRQGMAPAARSCAVTSTGSPSSTAATVSTT